MDGRWESSLGSRSSLVTCHSSLAPQRHHGIDLRRAARGDVTRGERSGGQQQEHACKRERVRRTNAVEEARKRLRLKAAFKLAKIPDGHAHRFLDTFAVSLLQAGVPMERVSVLLGHSSIKVTEKYYSPWVRARQEQLEADVRRTWESVLPGTKGRPEVHEKTDRSEERRVGKECRSRWSPYH